MSESARAVSGKVDQAGGLVLGYRDANNCYLTKADSVTLFDDVSAAPRAETE